MLLLQLTASRTEHRPRANAALSSVGGSLFLIGGMTFAPNPKKPGFTSSLTLVDSWKYEPVTQKWTRLVDFPIASCNFQTNGAMYVRRKL